MTSAEGPPAAALPAYADYVGSVEAGRKSRRRWPFAVLTVLGVMLIAAPIVAGMFPRTVRAQALISGFAPYTTESVLRQYRSDLRTLDDARANVLALQARGQQPDGADAQPLRSFAAYDRIGDFVRDYPAIQADLSSMLTAIDRERGDYRRLAGLPPFGLFAWMLAFPGVIVAAAGVFGCRRARAGRGASAWLVASALAGAGLAVFPLAGGLMSAGSAGRPLIAAFRPILTHAQVRRVQGYFVTVVAADGEIDSRYVGDVRAAHPDADLTGVVALESDWQPMTSRFAALIGAMNDNVDNFDAVVALDGSTRPLGFSAFEAIGWCYLIPGALVLATAAAARRPSRAEQETAS
jgi:hypothetical protein